MARRSEPRVKLYRKMFAADDGRPLVGDGRNMLGLRPFDPKWPRQAADTTAVAAGDPVVPPQGLSVFTSPDVIPPRVEGVMWVIATDDLPATMTFVQAGRNPAHYHITPRKQVSLDVCQQWLADTRELWDEYEG